VEAKKSYPLNSWARTAAASTLVVEFSPNNIFRLLPNSEIQVSGAGETNAKFRRVVQLTTGAVSLDLSALPKGSEIKVETPTAVCGAVGTVFSVDALSGTFECTRGRIFAKSNQDSGFQAESISGSITLAPGVENAGDSATISGRFQINGRSFEAENIKLRLAKAKGGSSTAAVEVTRGDSDLPSGSFLVKDGKWSSVPPQLSGLHSDYLDAALHEGKLNLRKQSLAASHQSQPPGLETELAEAARKATELRNKLFAREVMRDVARETVQQLNRESARPPR
jgi:hypothetical protein